MDQQLHKRKCVPCEGGTPPLIIERMRALLAEVPGWELREGLSVRSPNGAKEESPMAIARTVQCKNFKAACALFMQVALACEEEGHHADIRVFGWRNIEFVLSTHAVGGLSENDFIMAAKINRLLT